jgi:hypothetical protein
MLTGRGYVVKAGDGDTIAYRPELERLRMTDVLPFAFLKRG